MIKNYTSNVPPERSVNYIEKILVSHGARNIMKTYTPEGYLGGLSFVIAIEGIDRAFRLPARIDRIEKKLKEKVKRERKGTRQKIAQQAQRTAWKILAEDVAIQMTKIDLGQTELLEGFLSYVYVGKEQTFFDRIKEGSMRLLNPKGET